MKEDMFEWEFDFNLPRMSVWAFAANTQRINRLAGVFNCEYEYVPKPEGGSTVHVTARRKGVTMRYIEEPALWVEGEYFEFLRTFSTWPLVEMRVRVELSDGPAPNTTHLHQRVWVKTRGKLGQILMKYSIGVETKKGFMRAYGQCEDWVKSHELAAIGSEKPKATVAMTRMMDRRLLSVLSECPISDVSTRLRQHLTSQPDSELATLRPYELADRWGMDRKQTLDFFLHATREGLLDLRWQVLCPSCRSPKDKFKSLAEVGEEGHCDACNINYGVNFDRSIEAVFSPEPIGLGKDAMEYCHFSPSNTPFRVASVVVPAGQEESLELRLDRGSYQLVSDRVRGGDFFQVADDEQAEELAVTVNDQGFLDLGNAVKAGLAKISIKNDLSEPLHVYLQRTAWADDAVTAAEITALQEFRDLFGSEALAPGAEFAIQRQVFLFSDLTDSTAMYEAIGDATAFGMVREHFDVLREVYEAHNGALVKTIGDAVMAVFRAPADAVRAAVQMHEVIGRVRNESSGHVLALKIGVHAGPCIAMEANGLIDYFGGTVNMAARVQGKAGSGELVLSDVILKDSGVKRFLAGKSYPMRDEEWKLKGLDGSFSLRHIIVDPNG